MVKDAAASKQALEDLRSSTDSASASVSKMASQMSWSDEASQKAAASAMRSSDAYGKLDIQLTRLMATLDPVYARTMQLDQANDLLNRSLQAGLITEEQYQLSLQQLALRYEQTAAAAGHAASGTSTITRELMVVGREAMSGNISRIPGSLMVLSSYLSGILGPIAMVGAAVTAGGMIWEEYGKKASKAAADTAKAEGESTEQIVADLNKQIDTLKARNDLMQAGVGGVNDAQANKLESLRRTMMQDADIIARLRASGAQEGIDNSVLDILEREYSKATAEYNSLANLIAQKDQLSKDLKEPSKADKADAALLNSSKQLDAEMLASHEDSFTKTIEKWVDMRDQMIAANIYSGKVMEDHERAYTEFVNAENNKRLAAALAAADKQTAMLEDKQNQKFAALQQAADEAGMSDQEKSDAELQRKLAQLDIEREIMATDHNLTLEEEQRFQTAKLNLKKIADAEKLKIGKEAFIQDLATLGKYNSAFLAAYKIAAVSEIMGAGGVRAEKSAAWAAQWGPEASALVWAASWTATLANAAAVAGFLGGGGASSAGSGASNSTTASGSGSTYTYAPATPVASNSTVSAPVAQFNTTIIGAKDNPDKPLISYNQMDEFFNMVNQAGDKGYRLNANLIAS